MKMINLIYIAFGIIFWTAGSQAFGIFFYMDKSLVVSYLEDNTCANHRNMTNEDPIQNHQKQCLPIIDWDRETFFATLDCHRQIVNSGVSDSGNKSMTCTFNVQIGNNAFTLTDDRGALENNSLYALALGFYGDNMGESAVLAALPMEISCLRFEEEICQVFP